ncbi:MAG: stage V sporulation protein AE [Bacillota bacterium]|nr:stage V sporulation protein AE [Bacillota bacterium]
MTYVRAFLVGGAICVVAQLILDLTRINPAHVMVLFVCLGALISGLGLYAPLVEIGGAGATVPLTGFGHALFQGVAKNVATEGPVGLLTGGLRATALGLSVAVVSGAIVAIIFNPKG